MKALLDTIVLSELGSQNGDPNVLRFLSTLPRRDLFVSVLTLGEIGKGIALLPSGSKKAILTEWLADTERTFHRRIVPVDVETARIWGEVTARARLRGMTIPPIDGLIAATALQHGLHVLTRNVRDSVGTGALIFNPWQPV